MYSLISNKGKVNYDIKKFVIDTAAEIADLPTDGAPGSMAFAIDTGAKYMLNSEHIWKLLPAEGGSGGGGGIDPTATYIYDGGLI